MADVSTQEMRAEIIVPLTRISRRVSTPFSLSDQITVEPMDRALAGQLEGAFGESVPKGLLERVANAQRCLVSRFGAEPAAILGPREQTAWEDTCIALEALSLAKPTVEQWAHILRRHEHSGPIIARFDSGQQVRLPEGRPWQRLEEQDLVRCRDILPAFAKARRETKALTKFNLGAFHWREGRFQNWMEYRIVSFVAGLEALFSTHAQEVAHQLSERVASFLEQDPLERVRLFKCAKKVYKTRSKIVHGGHVNPEETDRAECRSSQWLRKALLKIVEENHLSLYRRSVTYMDDYFAKLVLGATLPGDSSSAP